MKKVCVHTDIYLPDLSNVSLPLKSVGYVEVQRLNNSIQTLSPV